MHGKRFVFFSNCQIFISICVFVFEKQGLKTGMYYLRTRPAADPIKFTVDKSRIPAPIKTDASAEKGVTALQEETTTPGATTEEQALARRFRQCNVTDENGACLMCSS